MAYEKISPSAKEALLKLASGYEYEEKEVIAGKNGQPERVRITRRHVPPDIRAIDKIEWYKSLGMWE